MSDFKLNKEQRKFFQVLQDDWKICAFRHELRLLSRQRLKEAYFPPRETTKAQLEPLRRAQMHSKPLKTSKT